MLQHQAKCWLIPMPLCEWDKKARCTHNSSIPLIPQRLCRTQDGITINWTELQSCSHLPFSLQKPWPIFTSSLLVFCWATCCFKCPSKFSHTSFSAARLHHPAATSGFVSANVFFYFLFLSGTGKPQSTRPHNPDNWKSGAMQGPPLFKQNYSESVHVHPLLAEWLNASLCDWSIQNDIPFLQQCGLHPHTVATAICVLNLSLSPIVWHLVF